jgi:hypothetical protein
LSLALGCSGRREALPLPPPVEARAPKAEVPVEATSSIVIDGDAEFAAWTEQALALLRAEAPQWHEHVEASIKIISSVPQESGVDIRTGTYEVGDLTAHGPGLEPSQQLAWYASTIVHDATHVQLFREGKPYDGKESEIACLKDQAAVLALIDTEPHLGAYVQGLIDGADDPANQYWNASNRWW